MYPNICRQKNKQQSANGIKEVLLRANSKDRDALLSNWVQTDCLFKLKRDCLWGEAGHAISELCAGRATKNVYVETNNNRNALLSNWGQTNYLFKLKRDCL